MTLVVPEKAKRIYEGKSKDVWKLEDGTVILDFTKDTQTIGADGKPDPGGNENSAEKVQGLGKTNLAMTVFFFQILKDLGYKTQMIDFDIEQGLMHAQELKVLGNGIVIPELMTANQELLTEVQVDGIEVIGRRRLTGSYRKRHPGKDMERVHPLMVEYTIKNDDLGDPLISLEQLIAEGIMTDQELLALKSDTVAIEKIIQKVGVMSDTPVEVVDFKLEFGKNIYGKVYLGDELSAGSMRATLLGEDESIKDVAVDDGEIINSKFIIAGAFLGTDIVGNIQAGQLTGLNKKVLERSRKTSDYLKTKGL